MAKTFPAQLKASLRAMLPLLDWLEVARQDPDVRRPQSVLTADERRQIKQERRG